MEPQASTQVGLLPLIIGASGHRDPAEPDLVFQQVCDILAELDRRAPETPFHILSPLAVGGDRIIANAALWLRGQRLKAGCFAGTVDGGVKLVGVLPFSVNDYRLDFGEAADRAEFESLLKQCDWTIELPIHDGAEFRDASLDGQTITAVDGGEFGRDRNEGYVRLGRFVAVHAHLLIAMWNGLNTSVVGSARTGVGGTWEVVRFCRYSNATQEIGGVPLHYAISPILSAPSTPVALVHTPRKKDSDRPFVASFLAREFGLTSTSTLDDRIRVAAGWNGIAEGAELSEVSVKSGWADATTASRALDRDPPRTLQNVLEALARINANRSWAPSALRDSTTAFSNDRALQELVSVYERLDAVAMEDQRAFERSAKHALCALVLAILCFQVFSSWSHSWSIFAYLTILVWSRRPRRWAKHREQFRAESRAFAELVRVQIFWRVAAMPSLVSDRMNERRVLQLGSFRQLFRSISMHAVREHPARNERCSPERMTVVAAAFIEDQIAFRGEGRTAKKRAKERVMLARLRWSRRVTLLLGSLGLAVSCIIDFSWLGVDSLSIDSSSAVLPWINLLIGASLLSVFFLDGWRTIFGTREDVAAADATLPLFRAAHEQLKRESDAASHQKVLERIGTVTIDEQLEWYLRRRDAADLDGIG